MDTLMTIVTIIALICGGLLLMLVTIWLTHAILSDIFKEMVDKTKTRLYVHTYIRYICNHNEDIFPEISEDLRKNIVRTLYYVYDEEKWNK